MSRNQKQLTLYLDHILEAISRIQHYVEEIDESLFLANGLIQDAVIRNFEVIGEASRNITKHYPEYVKKHAHIPFSIAYEMRNSLAHGYFQVDLAIVWTTIENDLPELDLMISDLRYQSTEGNVDE